MKFTAFLISLYLIVGHAQAACRQALIFALDVSSSVDQREYSQQMQGLAGALLDVDVQALLLSQPSSPVSISVFEWSGRYDQRLVLDWREINTHTDLLDIATLLNSQSRREFARPTAIGHALKYAGQKLQQTDCWQLTIDISGDGRNNYGFSPRDGKTAAIFDRVTVNALVIGINTSTAERIIANDIDELTAYFRHVVIHGPEAFIEIALGFNDYEAAMKRKLLRELSIAVASANLP